MMTNDVRKYDPTTGAFLGILCPATGPSDMRIGPNGNLYICLYGAAAVLEVDAVTGATVSTWSMPAICRPNDIAFLPGGDMIVTAMGANIAFRFDAAHNVVGVLSHSLWGNPHGVDIGPHDGNIYIVDGVTGQTHVFDPATNLELNPAYLIPTPGDKIVDLEFKRPATATPAIGTTWGAIKQLWR
jgi:DNA-binding beta-propeller fold protein YncE